jgi:hypothetical protein
MEIDLVILLLFERTCVMLLALYLAVVSHDPSLSNSCFFLHFHLARDEGLSFLETNSITALCYKTVTEAGR